MNNRMIGMTVALTLGAVLASGLQARAEEPFCALRVGWNTAEPKFWPQMRVFARVTLPCLEAWKCGYLSFAPAQ